MHTKKCVKGFTNALLIKPSGGNVSALQKAFFQNVDQSNKLM